MDYEYFKNKTIYDVNKEELLWLKKNSFINEYVFYCKLHSLNNKMSIDELILDIDSIDILDTKECKLYLELYYKNKTFNSGMLFAAKLNKLIDQLNDKSKFDEFISNKKYISSFANICNTFYDIETSVVEDVFGKYEEGIRWQLWPEKLVRDINEKGNPNIIMRKGLILAENGEHEKGISYIDQQLNENEFTVHISSLYYKMMLLKSLNRKTEILNIIEEFDKYMEKHADILPTIWNLTSIKVSLFYLNAYEIFRDKIYLEKYKAYLYLSFKCINIEYSRFKFLSQQYIESNPTNIDIVRTKKCNIELIREYFLNVLTYSYIVGDNDDSFKNS